jgi:hypothetical protein
MRRYFRVPFGFGAMRCYPLLSMCSIYIYIYIYIYISKSECRFSTAIGKQLIFFFLFSFYGASYFIQSVSFLF